MILRRQRLAFGTGQGERSQLKNAPVSEVKAPEGCEAGTRGTRDKPKVAKATNQFTCFLIG